MSILLCKKKHLDVKSISRRIGERSGRNPDTPAIGIIHAVEPFEPSLTVDKVQTFARV